MDKKKNFKKIIHNSYTPLKETNSLNKYPFFSVAMSVYKKDNEKWFDKALESITNQTINPNEIILVIDGPISNSIQNIINKYTDICYNKKIIFKTIYLAINKGLGNALKLALENCTHEIVARMDSDDIAVSTRFEQQLNILSKHPEIDILGGDILEFIDNNKDKTFKRIVPITDSKIKQYLKKRCPFNHMTVMYRKSSVLNVGSYMDIFWNEDYFLWIRMAEKKCIMANTGTILVKVRINKDMYKRRGGIRYFKSEKFLQSYMLRKRMITIPEYCDNLLKRFIVQVILPPQIRGWIFQKLARN